jgi:hypothetical protein
MIATSRTTPQKMSGRVREKDLGGSEHNMKSKFFTQPSHDSGETFDISPARADERRYDTASQRDEYEDKRYIAKGFLYISKIYQDSMATR